jgi:hypothetical protein
MTTLTIADLESVLRGVAQLSGVQVTQPYPYVAPERVKLEGAINVHGQTFFWETEISLADLQSRDDIVTLIEQLLRSFERAEKKGTAL